MVFDGIENRFIFPAPTPSYGALSYKRHLCWIPWNQVISPERSKDQTCAQGIPCLWFSAPRAATVLIFFHANAEDLGMSYGVVKHIRDQFKVNVLAVEYPGYGLLSHLKPSEDGVYEVALTAFRYLFDVVKVQYSQIVLFGRSLGSGPAVHLASQYPVGGLILVSAFSSIRGAVQSIAGSLLAWSVKEHFPNLQLISNVSCSTLIIHGESDGLIPVEHSLRLFKRCRARKLLATPPTMDHNSNLFAEASFLAVPAIHFFGFPGFCTANPPKLPCHLFEKAEVYQSPQKAPEDPCMKHTLCGCLAKKDPHHLDVNINDTEHVPRDITIRYDNSPLAEVPASIQIEKSPNCVNMPTKLDDLPLKSGFDINDTNLDDFYGHVDKVVDDTDKTRIVELGSNKRIIELGSKENIDIDAQRQGFQEDE